VVLIVCVACGNFYCLFNIIIVWVHLFDDDFGGRRSGRNRRFRHRRCPFVDSPTVVPLLLGHLGPTLSQPVHGGDREYGLVKWAAGQPHQYLRLAQCRLQLSPNQCSLAATTPSDGGALTTPNTFNLTKPSLYRAGSRHGSKDHVRLGLSLVALYGETIRYTNSYGLASYHFNGSNNVYGYDFPMVYADIYIPQIFEGMNIRIGRYISPPDIERHLAPNNYPIRFVDLHVLQLPNTGILRTMPRQKLDGCSWPSATARKHHMGTPGRTMPNLSRIPCTPGNTCGGSRATTHPDRLSTLDERQRKDPFIRASTPAKHPELGGIIIPIGAY